MASLTNTFEGQTSGTTFTAANSGSGSGDAFNSLTTSGTVTVTYDSAQKMHGTNSLHINANATSTCNPRWTSGLNGPSASVRIYIRVVSSSAAQDLVNIRHSGGACATFGLGASRQPQIKDATGSTLQTFTALSLNTWYRLEIRVIPNASTTAGTIRFDYYAGDSASPVETGYAATNVNAGTGNVTEMRIGKLTSSPSLECFIDTVTIDDSTSTALGPYARSATGFLAAATSLSGTATKHGAGSGSVTFTTGLSGTDGKAGAATGMVGATLAASGTAAKTTSVTGSLPVTVTLSGTAAKAATATGALAFTTGLGGTDAKAGTTTGSLPIGMGLSGTASANSAGTASGTLGISLGLSGSATKHATSTGAVGFSTTLAGTAIKAGSAAGALAIATGLAGDESKSSAAAGSIGLNLDTAGPAGKAGTATGTLGVTLTLAGTALVGVETKLTLVGVAWAATPDVTSAWAPTPTATATWSPSPEVDVAWR